MSIYPFDQTGVAASNRVSNEVHTISSINGSDHNYIVPVNAPFFRESMNIYDVDNDVFLDEGTDYECTHHFLEADSNLARKVYGSVTFLDVNKTGTFRISYQTLGGDFVDVTTQAINNGLAALASLQTADWEDIANVPASFPVTAHTQPVTDIQGVQQIIDSLIRMEENFRRPVEGLALSDITDLDTEFVTPLHTNLQALTAAIQNRQFGDNIPHGYWQEDVANRNLGAKTDGSWFDTGASFIIPQTGNYLVDWNGSQFAVTEDVVVQYRYLADGIAIPGSYHKGGMKSFQVNMTLTLQARVVGGNVSAFYTDRNNSPLTFSGFRVGI